MAKPTNTVKTINVKNTDYEIVPSRLSGNGYLASLPTLSKDETLSLSSHTHSFSDISSRGEAFLTWGGKNYAGSYAPIDAAMNPVLSPNRIAGMRAAGIVVEYSTDAGASWNEYTLTDASKISLVTTSQGIRIVPTGVNADANSRLRITLDGVDGSVYTAINKIHMYVSTNYSSGCTVDIDSYDYNSSTEWHQVVKNQALSGWSGWNVINMVLPGSAAFGGTNNNTHQRKMRFTFKTTGITAGKETQGFTIYKLYAYGGVGWTAPSTLAANGVPYTYDYTGSITTMSNLTTNTLYASRGYLGKSNSTSANSTYGQLTFYDNRNKGVTQTTTNIVANGKSATGTTANTTLTLPSDSGTIALTKDIPSVPSWALAATPPTQAQADWTETNTSAASYIKNKPNVATLDASGKVPSSQLPSFVDDVIEYNTKSAFPTTGESGKIYIDKSTNLTWRWSGSTYVEISPSLALGETSSTAFPGDQGKAIADELYKFKLNTITLTVDQVTSLNPVRVMLTEDQAILLTDNDIHHIILDASQLGLSSGYIYRGNDNNFFCMQYSYNLEDGSLSDLTYLALEPVINDWGEYTGEIELLTKALDGRAYSEGQGILISDSAEISIDSSVVATKEDIPNGEIDINLTDRSISIGDISLNPVITINNQASDANGNINIDIPVIPDSLPANGGNADTVDNKHASDFAAATHDHDNKYLLKTGGSISGDLKLTGMESSSTASKQLQFTNADGTVKYCYFTGNTANQFIIGVGNSSLYNFNAAEFRPVTGANVNLGSTSYPWPKIYATTIYEGGTALSSKYAAKTHSHTTSEITDWTNATANFLTSHQSLEGYATETWVTNKHYLTSGDISGKQDKIDASHKLDYSLIDNTPSIPAAQIQADWNQTSTSALDYIKNKPTLFSGNYNDLSNRPFTSEQIEIVEA